MGSACCPSGKVKDLVGQIQRRGQSASHGISGLCGDLVWTVYADTLRGKQWVKLVLNQNFIIKTLSVVKFFSSLNLPHAEAQVCLWVLRPLCQSMSTRKKTGIRKQVDLWPLKKSWKKQSVLTDIFSSLSRSISTAFWKIKTREQKMKTRRDDGWWHLMTLTVHATWH